MPSVLSRFKRSPSRTSNLSDVSDDHSRSRRRSSTSATLTDTSEFEQSSVSPVKLNPSSGSHFVENLKSSPLITPERTDRQNVPSPLSVTRSNFETLVETPKLVLTEEGASPRSFRSGSALGRSSESSGVSEIIQPMFPTPLSPTLPNHSRPSSPLMGSTEPHRDDDHQDERYRSGSVLSNGTRGSRSGSLVSRAAHPGKPTSPLLQPVESRRSSTSGRKSKKGKKGRKERSLSVGVAGPNGSIAAALAKSGLHIASPSEADFSTAYNIESKRKSTNRSPWLVRQQEDDQSRGDEEEVDFDDDDEDDEDESDSDLDEHLPVTGFAVASNRRQSEFHGMFPAVDEGDYLIEDYGCALSKDILVQGRLYVSENHLCFHANIFGWVTDVVVPFTSIRTIEKKMTALVIPNAIGVTTADAKYTFASFISRDSTYDVMMNIWRLCNPTAIMSTPSFALSNGSRPASIAGDVPVSAGILATSEKTPIAGHAETNCACGKDGKHYSEVALDTTFHSTPEKVYNLMFNSQWYKTFLSRDQKLKDVEMSDWQAAPETNDLSRSISYIKPLNASIGPKQTKCHIVDEHQHRDFDQYITMLTTTRTPDVPSGGVFSVKTRTCITWAGARSTRVLVTTTVEWTGKSWVKGIIEKSAIEGQRTYHDDLEKGMKAYMKEHLVEFAFEGVDEVEEPVVEKASVPTEAAAYAAQQRKQRQDRDFWLMQGGIDSVVCGVRSIAAGLKEVIEAIFDTVSNAPKETLFGVVIGVLVLSNIYTYFAYKSTKQDIRRARLGWNDNHSLFEEAREIEKLLDGIELRFQRLRTAARTVARTDTGGA